MKPIEELANEVGFYVAYENKDVTNKELEALRQAIIKDFVAGLAPVYWRWGDPKDNVWIYADEEPVVKSGDYAVQSLYSLEEWI